MQARAELSEREVKTLKRLVEELLVVDGEAKRLRVTVRDHEVSKAKMETESEHLKTTLQSIRTERFSADANMELSNQNAVSASQMLNRAAIHSRIQNSRIKCYHYSNGETTFC